MMMILWSLLIVNLFYVVSACPLDNPQVYVHFIWDHTINTTNETEEFWRLMETDAVHNCTAELNCCSCNLTAYLCSSMTDLNMLLLSKATETPSVFIGLLSNDTMSLKEVIQFDSWYSVAVTSIIVLSSVKASLLNCQENSLSGFVFKDIQWVLMENIELKNCGVLHRYEGGTSVSKATVILENNTFTEMRRVTIDGSSGSGVIVSALGVPAEVRVIGCAFHDNSISDTALYGGGVSIYTSTLLNVSITDTAFYNNQATYGGSIALIALNTVDQQQSIYFRVRNSTFIANIAIEDGGAFYQLGLVDFAFESCMFLENQALHYGGAIAIYGQNPFNFQNRDKPMLSQVLDDCEFSSNSASSYAVLYMFLPIISINENETQLLFQLLSVNVTKNYLSPEVYDSDNCILHFTNIDVSMDNEVVLEFNRGSVVCLNNANLHLKGNVLFTHNFGYRGGAVNMQGLSLIHVYENTTVDFKQNIAVYGGAIYKGGNAERLYKYDKDIHECTVFHLQNKEESYYVINFIQNSAKLAGLALYVVNSERSDDCEYQLQNNISLNLTENINATETSNLDIDFSGPSVDYNNSTGEITMRVSLGIYITLNTTITSLRESSALFYVTLFKDGKEYYEDSSGLDIFIIGPTALSLSQGLTFTNFYFVGPEIKEDDENSDYSNFSLTFYLAENFNTNKTVKLKFIPCKLGFEYSQDEKKCNCVESPHLLCSERQNLACIEKGFWYGEDGVVTPCYSGFCKNTYENCTICALESGGGEYCQLQLTEDEECIDDRTSRACVICRTGYSYTYGAEMCIEREKYCKLSKDIPIIIITSIIFLLLIMLMMYAMLKIDNKKHFGYFYVVTYYYTVIGFVFPSSSVTNHGQKVINSLIRSFVTLNPLFLGQFKVCCDTRHLVIVLLSYVFPIIVCLLIAIHIKLSQKFPKYFNYQDNVLIRGICVMTLLSFGAILETSFNIINPVQYSNKTYVSIQPDIRYLGGDSLYIVAWIFAMGFMLIFIIPLTFFLLFSPLIMRCFSIIRFRPFLDQFHACYKEEYRWMSGFYFLCRLVYFAIIIDPTTTEVSSYPYIRYASVIIVIIHCLLQPYQNKLLNISDAIILADIAFLSLLHNSQNVVTFEEVIYFLLEVPIVYLLALIVGFSFLRIKKFRQAVSWLKSRAKHYFVTCIEKIQSRNRRTSGWERQLDDDESMELDFSLDSAEFTTHRTVNTVNDAGWFTEPREPLLSSIMEHDENTPPASPTTTESPSSEAKNSEQRSRVTMPARIPNFSELSGDGMMSPGHRKRSFLVQYMQYQENSLNPNEITEVTGGE